MAKIKRTDVEVKVTNDDNSEKIVNIYVQQPNNNIIKEADRYRAKTWNACIMDGAITKQELAQLLEDRDIWNDEKNDKEKAILTEINNLEKELYLGKGGKHKSKLSDGKKIAIDIRRKRNELRDLISERISMEESTAEALADNAKFDYLVATCTFHEDGTKVYADIDDYNEQSANEIAFSAAGSLAEMMYSLDKDFEKSLPENRWLSKFNLVNEKLSLTNSEGDLVDVDGKRINELGHFMNDQDKRIDRDGHLLKEDGTYELLVEYEDDLSKPTKSTKLKRKKTVKAAVESQDITES